MGTILRKILVADTESMIRAAFSEDIDMLKTYHSLPNKGLDLAANDFLEALLPGNVFFRLENKYGAYSGFFALNMPVTTMCFHLRNSFRSEDYRNAFYDLVIETVSNELYSSLSGLNLTSLPGILKGNTFEIKNREAYHAKNFVLLSSNN